MNGFRCYDNVVPNVKCQRVPVRAHLPGWFCHQFEEIIIVQCALN